jgi:hypothetical protein
MATHTKVFISYSHRDVRWLERLRVHLKPLVRDDEIDVWDDTKIRPGSEWRDEIREAINSARVAILLVSADFLASDFIATHELPPLLSAAEQRGTAILPLILSPCRFSNIETIARFQAVNEPSRPLSSMTRRNQEETLVKVSEAIETLLSAQSYTAPIAVIEEDLPIDVSSSRALWRLTLDASIEEMDPQLLAKLTKTLQEISKDAKLSISRVYPGSIILELDASEDAGALLERLISLPYTFLSYYEMVV